MVKTPRRFLFPIILIVAGLLAPVLLPGRGFAAGNGPPNMVFILTDDHRWDALSTMGHPFLQTPHLDRLANEGILFENAFVTTSLCSPSRASFLTGQYAHTHGVVTNHTPWDNRNVTFLERLKTAGYETAFIGKWHMPGDGLPELRGVDRFVSFTREGGQGVYYDCPLIIDGVETARPGRYITEDLTDLALEFMARKREKPFCLYLSHKAVHFGFRPPPHLKGRYRDVALELPPESDPWVPYTNGHPFVGAIFPLDFLYRNYCETVVSVDEQIGRILAALDAMGIAENTVVVYAGDNGHFWGEHGLYDKRLAYEESIRIPFIVRYPRLVRDPGRRARQMVLNIDLAPTLLELAGIAPPADMQGHSLVPVLEDPTALSRTAWLYEHFPVFPIPIPGITAIRTERYKYVEYQKGLRPTELFDLKEDPNEKNNLVDTPEGKQQIELLKRELERLKKDTGYRFHTRG
jgi:arylsulfatase A-like enzyme